jgi:hypothetical protein
MGLLAGASIFAAPQLAAPKQGDHNGRFPSQSQEPR